MEGGWYNRLVSLIPLEHSTTGEHTYPKVFSKPSKSVNHQDLADRYALLQRKVHDLQELHAEGRKSVRNNNSGVPTESLTSSFAEL